MLLRVIFLLTLVWSALISSQFVVGHAMVMIWGVEFLTQTTGAALYSVVSYLLAILIVIVLMHLLGQKYNNKFLKTDREELGLKGMPTWTDIGLAPVGFVVYFLLAAGLTWVFSLFTWFDAGQAQEIGFNLYLSGTDRMLAFVILVVVAPVVEEIIFRGWLYGKMRSTLLAKLSDRWSMAISILLVSILFGIVHGQWNVGVNVFALSVVLCALREVTGTIYSGIILHVIKNFVAFCAIMFA